jgi:hypothetical protein
VGAPNAVVRRINNAVRIAVCPQIARGFARSAPDDIIGRVDRSVAVVVAGRDNELIGRLALFERQRQRPAAD